MQSDCYSFSFLFHISFSSSLGYQFSFPQTGHFCFLYRLRMFFSGLCVILMFPPLFVYFFLCMIKCFLGRSFPLPIRERLLVQYLFMTCNCFFFLLAFTVISRSFFASIRQIIRFISGIVGCFVSSCLELWILELLDGLDAASLLFPPFLFPSLESGIASILSLPFLYPCPESPIPLTRRLNMNDACFRVQ